MLDNSEYSNAKTNLYACNTPFLHDTNFSGIKDELCGKFAVAIVPLGMIGYEQVDKGIVELCRHQQADLVHITAIHFVFGS
jgi:hypothetical protein